MRKSLKELYEELKKEGLLEDFSLEKFYRFVNGVFSGEGGKGLDEEKLERLKILLKEWKESISAGELFQSLRELDVKVSKATFYRYLRKVPKELVISIEGVGKRYRKRALRVLMEALKYGSWDFTKKMVSRFSGFPEILEFVIKKTGKKEVFFYTFSTFNMLFKEKSIIVGENDELVVVVFVPSVVEGWGIEGVVIRESLIEKVLSFKNKGVFTSLYIGSMYRNIAILIEDREGNELYRQYAPEGIEPLGYVHGGRFRRPFSDRKTEVYIFSDLNGKIKKISEYSSLFIGIPEKVD